MNSNNLKNEIAVIGMAGRFPGAANLEEFWNNLKNGKESISFFSNDELMKSGVDVSLLNDANYIKAKGIVDKHDCFDASFFNYSDKEAAITDPQLRLLLECSREAIENSGYSPEEFPGKIGAFVGIESNYNWVSHIKKYQAERGLDRYDNDFLFLRDFASTTISYKLNLRGPSINILTACSTSLVAIHYACRSLINGECEMAIAGGAAISFPSKIGYLHIKDSMVSSDGHCRAFDEKADGTVWGDGLGVVMLKPLHKALENKDFIYAIIKGSGVNNDGGKKISFTTSSKKGQVEVIKIAQEDAGIELDTIGYIEAHGTGTRIGDPYEVQALKEAFNSTKREFCAIGSLKSNIGHLSAAAGIAGFIKTVLVLKNKQIPPSLHVTNPNPRINFKNSPFYVNTKLTLWKQHKEFPRRAAITSLGFGGTNAHIILEEAANVKNLKDSGKWRLITISAKTKKAIENYAKSLIKYLIQDPTVNLDKVSYTLVTGRTSFEYRYYIVYSHRDYLIESLTKLPIAKLDRVNNNQSIVFMFPGQGSQHIDMCKEYYKSIPQFKATIDYCTKILRKYLNIDLSKLIYPDDKIPANSYSNLNQTIYAQPAIFIVSYALAKLWISWGIKPQALIGHSMGELVSACLANVISLEDALKIIAKRGQFIQNLPSGVMLVVPQSVDSLNSFINDNVSIAAINTPTLCILSGPYSNILEIEKKLQSNNIKCSFLNTSHAFHSQMLDPILSSFEKLFENIILTPPKIPILSTVTGKWLTNKEAISPKYWVRNLRETVNFSDAIQHLLNTNTHHLLEVGPGKTLLPLIKSHSNLGDRLVLSSSPHLYETNSQLEHLFNVIGKLWVKGFDIKWNKLYEGKECGRVPLPTYAFEKKRFEIDILDASKKNIYNRDSSVGEGDTTVINEIKDNKSDATEFFSKIDNNWGTKNKIRNVWKKFLSSEQIKYSDNFFDLGGNSLMATYIASELQKFTYKEITVGDILDNPTIDQFYKKGLIKKKKRVDKTDLFLIRSKILDTYSEDRKTLISDYFNQYFLCQSSEFYSYVTSQKISAELLEWGITFNDQEINQIKSIDNLSDYIILKLNLLATPINLNTEDILAINNHIEKEINKTEGMSDSEIEKLLLFLLKTK